MHQIEGLISEDLLRAVWNAFGISFFLLQFKRSCYRPLCVQTAANGPRHYHQSIRFLQFQRPWNLFKRKANFLQYFEIKTQGVTNPIERDKRLRVPVFIVSKEFVKGKVIKSGIGNPLSGLRPYSVFGSNGSIQQTKVNYTEIGHYANVNKDQAKMGIDRVVRQLSDKAKMVLKSLLMWFYLF